VIKGRGNKDTVFTWSAAGICALILLALLHEYILSHLYMCLCMGTVSHIDRI
jgi:hypothetical protein